ncbi:MAG: D-alanyl-D-alanine carboxypeptidase/D-alanyl-D-alanine-endopeptidase [Vicinamibacteria bacterium]
MRRLALALGLGLALAGVAEARDPSPGSLKRAIDRLVDRPAFASATWGIEVRSLTSRRVLYARNAGKNMKPASTLKLLATAAALDAFGPDDRVRTTVETSARQDALGRLLGDVHLVGRGDANLSGRFTDGRITAAFEELADALVAAGVKRIEGRLVGNEGLFRGDRRGDDWAWDDLVWWYGAEVSALSFNDNSLDLEVGPGERAGDPVVVDSAPLTAYARVESVATTSQAGAESDLTVERPLGGNVIRISGTHPLGKEPWQGSVALEDPARYAASVFAEVLSTRGIRVTGGVATSSEPPPADARVLAAHAGPPLSEALKAVNKPSQNLHAELLLRRLGAGRPGQDSLKAGHEALREFLKRSGVPLEAGDLRDGSGLSRSDLISPHQLVELLVAMDRHPHAQVFRDSLPIAGVDGTLKKRLATAPTQGRVLAKTGTLRHVSGLAGYAPSRAGARIAFAIVVNHHDRPSREAIAAIDEIVRALVGS